jgi:hypothetical protein
MLQIARCLRENLGWNNPTPILCEVRFRFAFDSYCVGEGAIRELKLVTRFQLINPSVRYEGLPTRESRANSILFIHALRRAVQGFGNRIFRFLHSVSRVHLKTCAPRFGVVRTVRNSTVDFRNPTDYRLQVCPAFCTYCRLSKHKSEMPTNRPSGKSPGNR